MFCVKCGKSIDSAFHYCPYCAHPVGISATSNDDSDFLDIRNGVLVKYTGRASHVVIPPNVNKIGRFAFLEGVNRNQGYPYEKNDYVKKITISNRPFSLEEGAFYNCVALEEVTLPEGLTTIPEEAFCGCINLKYVHIPITCTSIGRDAFYCCNLEKTKIPESVKDFSLSIHGDGLMSFGGLVLFERRGKIGRYAYSKFKMNSKLKELQSWGVAGRCLYCGGKISLFNDSCISCHRKSSYPSVD